MVGGLGVVLGSACTPMLPFGSDGGWSWGYTPLDKNKKMTLRGLGLFNGVVSVAGIWLLRSGTFLGCTNSAVDRCWAEERAAMPVALPARLVHPARHYCASRLGNIASARGFVL